MSRRALLVALGAAVLLLVVWFLLLWGPQGGRLRDAEDRRTAAESANTALELRLARLQASQDRATELMAELEELRRAVPDDPELAQFILDANDIATSAGVDFLSITPGVPSPAGEGGGPPVITLNVSVRGTYESVLDYLRLLEELPRIVVVDALGLTPGDDDTLSVSITARMFATTAPSVAPPTTTPATTATTAPAETTETTTATTEASDG